MRPHHFLVRFAHWCNVPLLLGLVASGLSIYWAAPVFLWADGSGGRRVDLLAAFGAALVRPFGVPPAAAATWIYDHLGLGTYQLAPSLNLHWLLAYLFMLNGLLYAVGLVAGGGWRDLVPRPSDVREGWSMIRYYAGFLPARLLRRPWPHPVVRGKYNALQRGAYFAMPLVGLLAVLSGWALHKPAQLGWLERAFGSYDGARIVHFACMVILAAFILPHVALVAADGWDTFRSMVTGWSKRARPGHGAAVAVPARRLRAQSRRDFLAFGAGVLAAAAGAWWLLPGGARSRLLPGPGHDRLDTLAARVGLTHARRQGLLGRVLTFDDDVAEALYSPDRRVRAYARSERTPLRNNYHGRTPGPGYLATWRLELSGLASGRVERLTVADLAERLGFHEQVTRLVCVEGWSAVAWWGGFRFADFLAAFPPAAGARYAALVSSVSLDARGRPEPYYVSLDLPTARHPQTLLATHFDGQPLTLGHGAPLRLAAPVKLGLKQIKAVTSIAYAADPPPDYWAERGYSRYDGI